MFQPGSNGVLSTVEQAAQNPNLYVRGVVSELPADDRQRADDQHADVAVVRDDQTQHLTTPIIEPEGIAGGAFRGLHRRRGFRDQFPDRRQGGMVVARARGGRPWANC